MHPFGLFGADMHEVSFHHFWRRAVANGMSDAVMAFNAEMQLAYSGRAVRPAPPLNYAYQFDAAAYGEYLRQYAVRNGVDEIDGKIASVERDDRGDIGAVSLEDGRRLEGDFFIDCTGFRALLIGQAMGAEFEDWSQWLPCNRALAMPSARTSEPFQFTRAAAQDWGWRWQIPLQHRTGNGMVYCDAFAAEAEVEQALRAQIDGAPLADPNPLRFVARRCVAPWTGNCLAIGLASGFLEPLESTSIHLIQAGILSFLTMFPDRLPDPSMATRYNRSMERLQIGIRDFIVAHYKLTERDDTPFWQHVSAMPIPDSLAERIDLFERRGEVLAEHGDLFKEANWFAVLDGMGVRARSWHPAADLPSLEELRGRMDQIASLIAKRAQVG
jgi:tryptophan halogenase